eukprot:3940716-Rhodomonas_salina.1
MRFPVLTYRMLATCVMPSTETGYVLRACYAISGTEVGYAATRLGSSFAGPVLDSYCDSYGDEAGSNPYAPTRSLDGVQYCDRPLPVPRWLKGFAICRLVCQDCCCYAYMSAYLSKGDENV